MLNVNIGSGTALLLRRGYNVKRERSLATGLRSIDFHNAPFGNAANPESKIQRKRAGGERLYVNRDIITETHDRSFAVVLFYPG